MKRIYLLLVALFSGYILVGTQTTYAQTRIKVLSLNCRLSGKMTGHNTKPFADYISKYDPDFILLQEVDYYTARNGNKDFTSELASDLGYFQSLALHSTLSKANMVWRSFPNNHITLCTTQDCVPRDKRSLVQCSI